MNKKNCQVIEQKMSSTQRKLFDLLNKYRTESVFFTHLSLTEPKGKFNIGNTATEDLWTLYCNLVSSSSPPKLGLAESPKQHIPVLVDIDIKLTDKDIPLTNGKLYTMEQVKQVISVYQSTLRKIIRDCNENHLICILLEKEPYISNHNDTSYIKNGFHLHFPYCFMNKRDQEVHLIPRVQDEIRKLNTFSNLVKDSGSLIDKASCKNSWLLYGSSKKESDPYLVTKVFNASLKVLSLEKAFSTYPIVNHKEQHIPIKGKVNYYLPRILSILPYGKDNFICELRPNLIPPLKEKLKEETQQKKKEYKHTREDKGKQLEIAKKMIPLLAQWRAEDYNEWMTVGWALYNITDGSSDGLELWCEFSSMSDKYEEDKCVYLWDRMVKRDITLGTLRYYARIDNPEKYKEYIQERAEKGVIEAIGGSHWDIAKILHEEYADEFVCVSITNKTWYQFRNHIWHPIEEGIYLRQKISTEIKEKFKKIAIKLQIASCDEQDKASEQINQIRLKLVNKLIQNLKSSPFKNNILRECTEIFYDERFRQKLDTNPNLIAFQNGVYDLQANILRAGRPEDFLSKSMPITYVEYTEDSEEVIEIYDFLEKVFPDKSIRKYFLDTSCEVFVGGNSQKKVIFWTGDGDNGKSVTQSFFEQMLGQLCIKFNTTLITGKKPSQGAAHAELARAGGGVRWAVLEEPDNDEAINVGIFKLLSGNDTYFARDLWEKGKDVKEIRPLFKLIFICNRLPRVKFSDKAFWNRTRVLPFEATFCNKENAPETYEEQLKSKKFPMDSTFSRKIPRLSSAFAWVLLEHRKKMGGKPIIEPDKVKSATQMYKKQNDIYRQFIEEKIIEDAEKLLTLSDLYLIFKEWFKESMASMYNIPPRAEIEEYFTKIWGEPEKGKKWKGYRERTIKDDIDDEKAFIMDENDFINYDEQVEGKQTSTPQHSKDSESSDTDIIFEDD